MLQKLLRLLTGTLKWTCGVVASVLLIAVLTVWADSIHSREVADLDNTQRLKSPFNIEPLPGHALSASVFPKADSFLQRVFVPNATDTNPPKTSELASSVDTSPMIERGIGAEAKRAFKEMQHDQMAWGTYQRQSSLTEAKPVRTTVLHEATVAQSLDVLEHEVFYDSGRTEAAAKALAELPKWLPKKEPRRRTRSRSREPKSILGVLDEASFDALTSSIGPNKGSQLAASVLATTASSPTHNTAIATAISNELMTASTVPVTEAADTYDSTVSFNQTAVPQTPTRAKQTAPPQKKERPTPVAAPRIAPSWETGRY